MARTGGQGDQDVELPGPQVDDRAVPVEPAPSFAGAPAALLISATPRTVHLLDFLPAMLADSIVLEFGALDERGLMIVSRYAADFPREMPLYAQAVMLVEGQILASGIGRFVGAGTLDKQ